MPRTTIHTDAAPKAVGPYVQGVRTGSLLFVSGQVALDPATGVLVDGGIEEQTRRVLRNLAAILESAGASLADVVKATVFLAEMGEFGAMNEIYARRFPDPKPARTTVAVRELPRAGRVEIEVWALLA